MKKNLLMRISVVLLAAVLFTGGVATATIAKYVSADQFSYVDTGGLSVVGVAKFGVTVGIGGALFSEESHFTKAESETGVSLRTSLQEGEFRAVKPGDKSDNAMTVSVGGNAEVAVAVKFLMIDAQDIFLRIEPEGEEGEARYYYPILYTLTGKLLGKLLGDEVYREAIAKTGVTVGTNAVTGNIEQIGKVLAVLNGEDGAGIFVDCGQNLSEVIGTLTLTWEWLYGDDSTCVLDTKLAMLADEDPDNNNANEDYSTIIRFNFTVSIVQVD